MNLFDVAHHHGDAQNSTNQFCPTGWVAPYCEGGAVEQSQNVRKSLHKIIWQFARKSRQA